MHVVDESPEAIRSTVGVPTQARTTGIYPRRETHSRRRNKSTVKDGRRRFHDIYHFPIHRRGKMTFLREFKNGGTAMKSKTISFAINGAGRRGHRDLLKALSRLEERARAQQVIYHNESLSYDRRRVGVSISRLHLEVPFEELSDSRPVRRPRRRKRSRQSELSR